MAISSNTKKLLLRIVLFLVYLLLGAAIFYLIEHTEEVDRRKENNFSNKYKNFTDKYKISKEDMIAFIKELGEAVKLGYNSTAGFNGSTTGWPEHYRWQFMNAFHFAGNVVTTIGYGHIAPITVWGRFLCIIYALFGIPLTGLTLRSIGNRISEFIAATIKSLDRRFYNRETEKLEIKTAFLAFLALLFIILIPAIGFSYIEGWEYQDAVYFCFVTLTTIGFGDFVPGQRRDKNDEGIEALLEFLNLFYMVLGLAVMSGVIVSISGVIEEKTKNFGVDPLEALRNIRVENLNSRALKKLGYKMGPGMGPPGAPGPPNHDHDSTTNKRLPPKLAPKAIAVVAASGADKTTMERSRSAEAMDFQGPTPVMYLNKTNGNIPSCGKEENKTGSPTGSKMFNNKIAPVTLPENEAISNSPSRKLDLRKRSEHNSTSTESAEEARADDEDSEVKTINELNELREEAELDACEPVNHEPKNNLVIQVQVTPMPSPRESPVHTRPSMDSITTNPKNEDPDTEPIETYEGSMKGSIDSSQAFQSDGTTAIDHPKTNGTKDNEPPFTNPFTQDAKEKQNSPHKAKTNDTKNHPRTKNGIIQRSTHSKPSVKRQGRTFRPVEHIDLGDKTISKVSR